VRSCFVRRTGCASQGRVGSVGVDKDRRYRRRHGNCFKGSLTINRKRQRRLLSDFSMVRRGLASLEPGLVVGSEDCLALDIYAPADAKDKVLPVMLWIHGGGNVWGRSSSSDGSYLAENEGVIVVAVQYRLGPLGWFSHEALRDSAQTPQDAAASFATLDLIASLRWVRDNIAAFGGDPGNVTIFGESDFKKLPGAAHGFEVPFVFHRFKHLGDADIVLFQKRTLNDRERLSRAMGGYWASFAHDGVPSRASTPVWPPYGENGGSFMRFDTHTDGGIQVINGRDSLDAVAADLKNDPRLDDAERCLLVEEMAEWMFPRPIRAQLQSTTECE